MSRPQRVNVVVTEVDDGLEAELDDAIYAFNVEATGLDDGRLLRAEIRDPDDSLIAGISGWTWGGCGCIDVLWVREDRRGEGLGAALLDAAEEEARTRGCTRMITSSHTFQAPAMYRRRGYAEIGRSEGYPHGHAHVHLQKNLTAITD